MVVDLPAPFGPRSPNDSPGATSNEMPSTAAKSWYFLTRLSAVITGSGTSDKSRPDRRHGRIDFGHGQAQWRSRSGHFPQLGSGRRIRRTVCRLHLHRLLQVASTEVDDHGCVN